MITYPDRVPLAHTPTPVDALARLSTRLGVELLLKRDDLTGAALTGNKVRKLEFLLADAQAAGAGGPGAGLTLGANLLGLAWRAAGFNVCDARDYFVRVIGEIVEAAIRHYTLDLPFDRREIEIIDGYVGAGYARSRPEEL